MTNIIDSLQMYFSLPFVRYAFIVGVLISLCSSVLGVNLVLKRLSHIGDSLAHATFGFMALGGLIEIFNSTFAVLIATALISIFITRNSTNKMIKGDAVLTLMSVSSLGVGYLVMSTSSGSSNLAADVCSTLFGSMQILTLRQNDVYFCVIASIIVMFLYVIFYNKIFAITFDEDFSRATGVKVSFYNLVISLILAIIIVLAIKLVGSLLISALIIFPALSSMRVFNNFKSVVISSCIFSVICSSSGIITSILVGTPVGPTIVAVDLVGFILFSIIGKVKK